VTVPLLSLLVMWKGEELVVWTGRMRKAHRRDVAYADGTLYARCDCGWEGTKRPLADGSLDALGNQVALRAAEREGVAHIKEVAHEKH
jgi:hypothetical protein